MSKDKTLLIALLATLALGVTILFVAISNYNVPHSFSDSASVLTFITGAAVGIERIIEAMWTLTGGLLGSYWPLNVINDQVKTMTGELDKSLKPFHEEVTKKIEELKKAGQVTEETYQAITKGIAEFNTEFNKLKNLVPSNQRVQMLAAATAQHVKYINSLDDKLKAAGTAAESTIDGLQNFIASFKDNPGRRLISIYLGAILGLIIAGVFGLNVIHATTGNTEHLTTGIVLTGILIGLGSGPTHEVIRVIQEYKESTKGANAKKPDLPN